MFVVLNNFQPNYNNRNVTEINRIACVYRVNTMLVFRDYLENYKDYKKMTFVNTPTGHKLLTRNFV